MFSPTDLRFFCLHTERRSFSRVAVRYKYTNLFVNGKKNLKQYVPVRWTMYRRQRARSLAWSRTWREVIVFHRTRFILFCFNSSCFLSYDGSGIAIQGALKVETHSALLLAYVIELHTPLNHRRIRQFCERRATARTSLRAPRTLNS
jgi:hypothetical protein